MLIYGAYIAGLFMWLWIVQLMARYANTLLVDDEPVPFLSLEPRHMAKRLFFPLRTGTVTSWQLRWCSLTSQFSNDPEGKRIIVTDSGKGEILRSPLRQIALDTWESQQPSNEGELRKYVYLTTILMGVPLLAACILGGIRNIVVVVCRLILLLVSLIFLPTKGVAIFQGLKERYSGWYHRYANPELRAEYRELYQLHQAMIEGKEKRVLRAKELDSVISDWEATIERKKAQQIGTGSLESALERLKLQRQENAEKLERVESVLTETGQELKELALASEEMSLIKQSKKVMTVDSSSLDQELALATEKTKRIAGDIRIKLQKAENEFLADLDIAAEPKPLLLEE